jgi:hypothetical protein
VDVTTSTRSQQRSKKGEGSRDTLFLGACEHKGNLSRPDNSRSRSYFTRAAAITCAPEMPTIDRGFTVISELRQISNHCPPGLVSHARLTGSSFVASYLVVCPKGWLTFKGPKGRYLQRSAERTTIGGRSVRKMIRRGGRRGKETIEWKAARSIILDVRSF